MPFGRFEFPNADTYDSDLRELVYMYKKLVETYDGLKDEIQQTIDFVNNFEQHADELIAEQVRVALAAYNQRLIELENLVQMLSDEINKDDGLSGQIAQLRRDLEQTNIALQNAIHDWRDHYNALLELMHEYKHDMDSVVESATIRLEQYIKDTVTKLDRLDVINPINGLFENIQNVLNDLAEIITRSYGLTAKEYDELRLTAHVYDSFRITAYDYSTKGYFELKLKLTQNLMISPFTGALDKYDNIIQELANLHKCALTAQEYDDRNITAKEYDKLLLTAWEYDWFGFKVAQTITAQRYDNLKLTAQQYDDKTITAEQYEHGMKFVVDTTLKGVCNNCGDYMILATQISKLTDIINEYTARVDSYAPVKVKAGVSYVGRLKAGETESVVIAPILTQDSFVEIESEKKGLYPTRVDVNPVLGTVTAIWPVSDTNMLYNVSVQNKK